MPGWLKRKSILCSCFLTPLLVIFFYQSVYAAERDRETPFDNSTLLNRYMSWEDRTRAVMTGLENSKHERLVHWRQQLQGINISDE